MQTTSAARLGACRRESCLPRNSGALPPRHGGAPTPPLRLNRRSPVVSPLSRRPAAPEPPLRLGPHAAPLRRAQGAARSRGPRLDLGSPPRYLRRVRVHPFLRTAAKKIIWAYRKILVFPIILYRGLVSPILPGSCIYEPSCSRYMQGAIERFGLVRGLVLGLARVFRCAGGLYTGGDDPVPKRFSFAEVGRGYRRFWRRKSE